MLRCFLLVCMIGLSYGQNLMGENMHQTVNYEDRLSTLFTHKDLSLDLLDKAAWHILPGSYDLRSAFWQSAGFDGGYTIVLMHGMAGFTEKYLTQIQLLLNKGHDVFMFDAVGHGASGGLIQGTQKVHIDDYQTYINSLDQMLKYVEIKSNKQKPLVCLASSMGAHVALRYVAENPNHPFAKLVFTTPMLRVNYGMPKWIANLLVLGSCGLGFCRSYAIGYKDFDFTHVVTVPKAFASFKEKTFYKKRQYLYRFPRSVRSGPTFGWVKATIKSMTTLNKKGYLSSVTVPIFVAQAGKDKTVDNHTPALNYFFEKSTVQLNDYANAGHDILNADPVITQKLWSDVDDFLKK
jgi:lysophospholipase